MIIGTDFERSLLLKNLFSILENTLAVSTVDFNKKPIEIPNLNLISGQPKALVKHRAGHVHLELAI